MLISRELIRTGDVAFPLQEHLVHTTPFLSTRAVGSRSQTKLTTTEFSTGFIKAINTLHDVPNMSSFQWVSSTDYLIGYSPLDPSPFRVYSFALNQWLLDSKFSPTSQKKLSAACQPRLNSNYFIFVFEDDTFITILIHTKPNSDATPTLRISPYFSLSRNLPSKKIKIKGKILSIRSHPTLPLVFITYSKGQTLVWSYEKNIKAIMSGAVSNNGSNEGLEDSINREHEAEDDSFIEDSETAEREFVAEKSSGLSSGGFFLDRRAARQREKMLFSLVAIFELPGAKFWEQMDEQMTNVQLIPNDLKVSFNGKLAAIIFSQSIIVLYDFSPVSTLRNFTEVPALLTLKYLSGFPLHAVAASASKESKSKEIIEYKLPFITFHPHVPLLFVTIDRRKTIRHETRQPSSGSSAAGSISTVSLPMTPLLYAVPVFKTKMFLGAIGSYEFDDLHSLLGINDLSTTLDFSVDSLDCTPVSGLISLNLRIFPHALSSKMQANEEHIFYTLSISEHWKERQGFSLYDSVLMNSLSVPLSVYLYGLPALSRYAAYVKKTDPKEIILQTSKASEHSIASYKCHVKLPNSSSNSVITTTEKNGLPAVYLLKTSSSEGYHLYEMDYLPSIFSQSNTRTSSSKAMRSRFVISLPKLLTTDCIKAMIRQTYKWLKLEKSDYWLPPSMSSENILPDESASKVHSNFERRNSKLISAEKEFFFFPTRLFVWNNTIQHELIVGGKQSWILVKGIVRKIAENTLVNILPSNLINSLGDDNIESVVCLINPYADPTTGEGSIIACRDAAFVASTSVFCVAIDKTGRILKVFEFDASSKPGNPVIVCKKGIVMGLDALRLWYNGKTSSCELINSELCCVANDGSLILETVNGVLLSVNLSSVLEHSNSSATISLSNEGVKTLSLMRDELVLDIIFPAFSEVRDDKGEVLKDLLQSLDCHCSNVRPLSSTFAVRTTHRVLMISNLESEMKILDTVYHSLSRSAPDSHGVTLNKFKSESFSSRVRRLHQTRKNNSQTTSGSGRNSRNSLADRITDVHFCGNSLILISDSGVVRYFLPFISDAGPLATARVSPEYRLLQQAMAQLPVNAQGKPLIPVIGKVFSFPRNLSPHYPHSLRVIAPFPDRLLVAYGDRLPQYNSFRFYTELFPCTTFRPCNLLEPLFLSLLVNFETTTQHGNSNQIRNLTDICTQLFAYYAPLLPPEIFSSSVNRVSRYVPTVQLLEVLTSCLERFKFSNSQLDSLFPVESFANFLLSTSNRLEHRNVDIFPSGKWISGGIRAFWKFLHLRTMPQSLLLRESIVEIIQETNKPILVDLLVGSESFGGHHLPSAGSCLARRLSSLAKLFLSQITDGKIELSQSDFCFIIRLLDISADYSTLFFWLRSPQLLLLDESEKVKLSILSEFLPDIRNLSQSDVEELLSYVKDRCRNRKDYQLIEMKQKYGSIINLRSITKSNRSKLLHVSLSPLTPRSSPEKLQKGPNLAAIDADLFKQSCLTLYHKFGGVSGPCWSDQSVFAVKVNALDLLEEFMGTQQFFETIESSSSLSGMDVASGVDRDGTVNQFFKELPLPSTWVENIGVGRELDRVSAYYRFSDVFYPSEVGFVSTAEPFSRVTFLDLSKFEAPGLELFYEYESLHQFSVQSTESNINTGDKHESTKSLCDVTHTIKSGITQDVFLSKGIVESGFRVLVNRGAPLDIGCYHSSHSRNKMTLEMNISFQSSKESLRSLIDRSKCPVILSERQLHYDAQQSHGTKENSANYLIWRLAIESTGCVSFSMGETKVLTNSAFNLFTLLDEQSKLSETQARIAYEDEERDENDAKAVEFSPFFHFVLILDATNSPCTCQLEALPDSTGVQDYRLIHTAPVHVVLFVEGEKVLDNKTLVRPVEVKESQLSQTHLYFMPNSLFNYRITEVRVWSEIRSSQEINDQRDNYLLLAEKRYRLQMQLKGTRKLFTSFRDIQIGRPCDRLVLVAASAADPKFEESKPPSSNKAQILIPSLTRISGNDSVVQKDSLSSSAVASSVAPTSVPVVGGAMTARQRRLSALKDGNQISAGLKSSLSAAPAPVSMFAAESTASETSFASFKELPPVVPTMAPTKEHSDSHNNTPFVKSNLASTSSSTPDQKSSTFVEKSVSLRSLSTRWYDQYFLDGIKATRTRLLAAPILLSEIVKREENSTLEIVHAADFRCQAHQLMKICPMSIELPKDFSLSSENATVTNVFRAATQSCHVAVCSTKSLDIFDVSQRIFSTFSQAVPQKVVSLPLSSTSLVYFYYLTSELMVLITPSEGFTWKPVLKDDGKSRFDPIRVLQRVDLLDVKQWQQRNVLDVSVSAERWTLLVSCDNQPPNRALSLTQDYIGRSLNTIVSVHHAKSGKALSFRAVSGAFKSPGQLLLLFLVEWPNTFYQFKLVLLELNQLLDYATSSAYEGYYTKNSSYLRPVEYSEVIFERTVDINGAITTNTHDGTDDVSALRGLWSVAISLEEVVSNDQRVPEISPLTFSIANLYQINDKLFLLFSNGVLALIGANSLKFYGKFSLFSDVQSIIAANPDFSNLECPFITALVASQEGLLLLEIDLKPVTSSIKAQFTSGRKQLT